MSDPASRPSHPNTYAVQGTSGDEELHRLRLQDQMYTTAMGGVLPEQPNQTRIQRVLDIGCGPGGWLIEAAQTYPNLSQLIGVDVNPTMLKYARTQAQAAHVDDRVTFRQMDALRLLEFPANHFDMVNARFAMSWLRTWDWPGFLRECQRVARPRGIIRLTEFTIVTESSSTAIKRLGELAIEAFSAAGHLFTPESDGVTKELAHLLERHGLENVQTRAYVLEYRAGTPEGHLFCEDWKRLFQVLIPFLQKWTHFPNNYKELYQQMLSDMEQPDFLAVSRLLTAWGTRPPAFSLPTER